MADLVVIVPSRGRPDAAAELRGVFAETCTANTRLVFAVDRDDETQLDYVGQVISGPGPSNMVTTLNAAARIVTHDPRTTWGEPVEPVPFAIAFMGDDHRPRTTGWDAAYLETLRELGTGMVYGDDLIQGENLPTQIAMTSDIVRALGHMAPPQLVHLFVDNYWLSLGRLARCIRYRPDVVIEHVHPITGKVEWDEGHARVNQPRMYEHDARAFDEYVASGKLGADVVKVEALRAG